MNTPNIKSVCDHLDIQVMYDITEETGEENNPKVKEIVFLGIPSELAAGIRGFNVTPYFHTIQELEEFCKRNLERFLKVSEDEPPPDATHWE